MSTLPLALSLSNTFTKVGAIAAFAALVGIALLALLVFSQARELKRLRDWAGRAPERAAELEQRVATAVALRAQQQAPGVQVARAIPSGAPIQARAAAAGVPAVSAPAPGAPAPVSPAPVPAVSVPAPGAPAPILPAPGVRPLAPVPSSPSPAPAAAPAGVTSLPAPLGTPASAAGAAQSRSPVAGTPSPDIAEPRPPAPPASAIPPAPATAPPASATAPPAPATAPPAPGTTPVAPATAPPAPATAPSAPATAAAAASMATKSASPAESAARPPLLPPAPAPPAAAAPSALPVVKPAPTAAKPAPAAVPSRLPPVPPPPPGTAAASATSPSAEGRSVYAAQPASARVRPLALIAGGAILVAAGVAVALGVLGGSTSSTRKTVTGVPVSARLRGAATGTHSRAHAVVRQVAPKAPAVSPAETSVAVLNATEAEGLAHRTAAALQQSGYSQATALSGRPPGPGQVSVVEYTSGHQAEAEGVARSLSIAHVLPIEAGVSALAESANVVVILGEDRAGQTP